jgi:hypothetical protein
VIDEMELHRTMLERDGICDGLDPAQAARSAKLQFGSTATARDYARDAWTFGHAPRQQLSPPAGHRHGLPGRGTPWSACAYGGPVA